MEKPEDRYITICHHCGNTAPLNLVYHDSSVEMVDVGDGMNMSLSHYCFLVRCETCDSISLYGTADYDSNPSNWARGRLLYPFEKNLPDSIPEKVRKAYVEASRISRIAPNAFAGQIRRALEYLCVDKGAKGVTLCEMVKDLAAQETIPPTLAEMGDSIRILGNLGVHAGAEDISLLDVETMNDFFNAIVEYVYIAPSKLTALKERLSSKKAF